MTVYHFCQINQMIKCNSNSLDVSCQIVNDTIIKTISKAVFQNPLHLYSDGPMFQNMQDDVPIEVVKIQVVPAFRGFMHQFPNYFLYNIEGACKLCAI